MNSNQVFDGIVKAVLFFGCLLPLLLAVLGFGLFLFMTVLGSLGQ